MLNIKARGLTFSGSVPIVEYGSLQRPRSFSSFIAENVVAGSTVYTDDHASYEGLTNYTHESVNHSAGEYVRGSIHTNGIESFWSLFKRGHYGTFHQLSRKHLHRYLSEFEMRWNMSTLGQEQPARVDAVLESVAGLRLTYEKLIS